MTHPPKPSLIADLFASPRRSHGWSLGDILAGKDPLFDAMGGRGNALAGPITVEPGTPAALFLVELASITDEDPQELLGAVGDATNPAARVLAQIANKLAVPKGTGGGGVGRPAKVAEQFAAYVLGTALQYQRIASEEVWKRLAKALEKLGHKVGPDGAKSAFHAGRRRFAQPSRKPRRAR